MAARKNRRGRALVMALTVATGVAVPIAAGSAVGAASPLFMPYQAIPLGGTDTEAVAIGDVTGDGRLDVVATGSLGFADYRVFVLAGRADGSLAAPSSYTTAGSGTHPLQSITTGDVTGDGRTDVIVGAAGLGIDVFPQLADGTLGTPTLLETPDSLRVRVGDLDGSPGLDVAAIGWGNGTVSIFLNDGQGHLRPPIVAAVQHSGYDDLEIGDVTGDGRADIVVMSGQVYATPNISVLARLAGGGFATPAEYRVADQVNTDGIGIGDVTGDGRTDVVAAYGGNRPGSTIAVLAQTAGGLLTAPVTYPSYDIPTPVEIADLDRDGHADVVTLHSGWARAGVYRGQANGALAPEEIYALPTFASYDRHGLAIGDVTGDGWPDLVIADPQTGVVLLRSYGAAPPPTPTPSIVPSSSPLPTFTPLPSASASPKPNPTPTPSPTPTPTPQPPSAPLSLTASPNLASGVGLTWSTPSSAGSSPITGYRIYRGSGSQLAPLATIGAALAYTDTTVPAGATFNYAVSALSAAGEGPKSATVVAQRARPPSAPSGMSAVATKSGIAVSWTVPANGGSAITGYWVYRGTASGGETFLFMVASNAIGFTDTVVTHRVRYFYRVSAVNVIGEGPLSSEVFAIAR